jgi:N-carbamoyl-L-amino-acid hydrolase
MFDGAAGVLAALECLRTIREQRIQVAKPLEAASFTDEEGHLVGDFLGSRAFMGLLNQDEVANGRTAFGRPLREVLKATEFTVDSILGAAAARPDLEAYLELHIEQGPVLEDEGIAVGIVERIAGKHYRQCSFIGQAAHAGTTPLELRQDAFLGLADFALRATQHVATRHYGSMVTIGQASLEPGVFSVVPARADFSFEFRSAEAATLADLERELLGIADNVAATRGLGFASRVVDQTAPVAVAPRLIALMEEESRGLDYPVMRMTSGAGHDAQIIASTYDSGMIFVPCADGVSHSPLESVAWDDLEKGANLLLRTLVRLAA